MSSSNEINFGPVFMRGRKPVSGSKPPAATTASDPPPTSQARKPSGGPAQVLRPPIPSLGSFSSVSAPPLAKSFSAVVSPEKEAEDRLTFSSASNNWDLSHSLHDISLSPIDGPGSLMANGIGPALHEYSRETLLSLYSEALALRLPLDLETSDPAFSETFVGPPLGLIEMTESEKELFAGPFNSERRLQTNKTQHHNHNDNQTASISADVPTVGLTRLSVGNGAKIGKHHNPNERFNSLGIQGGVLAGVTSPTHPTNRRKGDSENDPPEGTRRFPRPDEPTVQSAGWSGNPGGRRNRDSGPPADGKWKRGVRLEEKIQSAESAPTGNHRYSVLDRMREKAAANLDQAAKEVNAQGLSANEISEHHDQSDQLSSPQATRDFENGGPDVPPATPSDIPSPPQQDSKLTSEPLRESVSTPEPDQPDPIVTSNAPAPVTSVPTAPEDIAWQYRDPSGTIQGPFTAFQMQEWYKGSFFRDDLLVKRVSDLAFETLETLVLRIGDRDKLFLVRPPPALPPNLPLPTPQITTFQTSNTAQSSPISRRSTTLHEQSSLAARQEKFSVFDSPQVAPNIDNNSLHVSSAADPWNSSAPSLSSLHRAGTLPTSTPLVTTSGGWHVDLPALSQPLAPNPNDYNASLISNGFVPNSFGQSDPRRFIPHIPHPALIASNNGYPYSLPMPHQPAFGQIPIGHHVFNGAGLDPLIASQLHPHLGLAAASYRGNGSISSGGDRVEAPLDPERHDQLLYTHPAVSADPWHMQPERMPPVQSQMLERNAIPLSMPTTSNNVDPTPPKQRDSWNQPTVASLEPIGTRSSGKNTPTSVSQDLMPTSTQETSHLFENAHASPMAVEVPITLPSATSASASGPVQSSASLSSFEKKPSFGVEEKSVSSSGQGKYAPARQTEQASVQSLDQRHAPQVEAVSVSDEPWQSVTHQPAAAKSGPTSVAVASAPAPVKQSGKIIVLSRAQQDEQDRRTASIAKTQQQLKEAQAIERAAREASEAAAAAATASLSAPAPWSTEDSKAMGSNLSLMEIQAIESKQTEKRRQAEKAAAANRASAEQAAAAERAAKLSKEALPATSNWAASSSPTKPSGNTSAPAVWGGKDSEGSVSSGPKQTMKQIQEEEARRKKLAQQHLTNKSAASIRPSGGYAGSVGTGAAKPAVSGPWSVVGAKSKVTAPPASGNRHGPLVSVIPGLPATTRGGKSVNASKSNASISNNRLNTASNNSSGKANNGGSTSTTQTEGPPPASPEFMKWLREALRGMNNVDDFMKMLLDFPINPDESVLEIVSDSVYAGSATLDGRRFAKEFNTRRHADVMARINNPIATTKQPTNATNRVISSSGGGGGTSRKTSTMADAVRSQPVAKNDGWGFAVVGAKKKKK